MLTAQDIQNPEKAKEYGVSGYVKISTSNEVKLFVCKPGDVLTINCVMEYVSYDPQRPTTVVNVNLRMTAM
jgi:hypothetical protein